MRKIVKYFLQGLLYVTPFAVTLYVFIQLFLAIDGLVPFEYPGLGLLLILVFITLIGFVGSYIISLPVFGFIDSQLEKVPLIKVVYTSVKDLIKAFVGQKKGFNKPVLVKLYENSEIRRMGFVTDETLHILENEEDTGMVTVYVPHSFAISGQLFIVPLRYLTPVKGKSADVMKYIIAGGVAKFSEDENEVE